MKRQFPHADYVRPPKKPVSKSRPPRKFNVESFVNKLFSIKPIKPIRSTRYEWERKKTIKQRSYDLKTEIIEAYGGKCECCGEANRGFLSIDHINRDGHKERKLNLYKHLKANGFPRDRYRLYCMNCNWGSRLTGVCPHSRLANALDMSVVNA